MREIRAALLKRVLLPSVLRARTGPSGRADHSFVHSVPSVISLSEKDKSGRRAVASALRREERRGEPLDSRLLLLLRVLSFLLA